MTTVATGSDFSVLLTEEERSYLLTVLEQVLKDKLVEEHRTDSISFREHVRQQGAVLQRVLSKLRR